MTAADIITKYLEDAFTLHPGHMTASGLMVRLKDAGYAIVDLKIEYEVAAPTEGGVINDQV